MNNIDIQQRLYLQVESLIYKYPEEWEVLKYGRDVEEQYFTSSHIEHDPGQYTPEEIQESIEFLRLLITRLRNLVHRNRIRRNRIGGRIFRPNR